jgi:hypothetical protein
MPAQPLTTVVKGHNANQCTKGNKMSHKMCCILKKASKQEATVTNQSLLSQQYLDHYARVSLVGGRVLLNVAFNPHIFQGRGNLLF